MSPPSAFAGPTTVIHPLRIALTRTCTRPCHSKPRPPNRFNIQATSTPAPRPSMRPKQSLGQNFLRDANTIRRIVSAFHATHESLCPDARVVEVGPGLGALTRELLPGAPNLHAIEIDTRAIDKLHEQFPDLSVVHEDVLNTDWGALSKQMDAPVAVIGNLPYNIVSQILLSLLDAPAGSVGVAVVMMQREVAERLIAPTRCKAYGILSVIAQLYSRPAILFQVPPTAFYPVPDVMSALVRFELRPMDGFDDAADVTLRRALKRVVKMAFNQRRKVLRNSLRTICEEQEVTVPERWADKRAEELPPLEFVELTRVLLGRQMLENRSDDGLGEDNGKVWR